MRRIPRKWLHILWVVPLLRMWIPVGLNSPFSLLSLLSRVATKTVTVYDGPVEVSLTNFVLAADAYFPITFSSEAWQQVFFFAGVVWAAVAAILLCLCAVGYREAKAEVVLARWVRDNVYVSDRVACPAVYGIVRPRILLPEGYTGDETWVLRHETAHIQRKDNLWRIVAIVTACIHWFNPLSWLFLNRFLANLELACDETVLSRCQDAEKTEYAAARLTCAEDRKRYTSAFGGAKIRVRLDRILSYKRLSAVSGVAFGLLTAVVAYLLLTNAA